MSCCVPPETCPACVHRDCLCIRDALILIVLFMLFGVAAGASYGYEVGSRRERRDQFEGTITYIERCEYAP